MTIKINSKYRFAVAGMLLCILASCSRSKFAAMNTDPDAVLNINPAYELTPGEIDIHNNDFEVFYDFVRNIKPWTQTYVVTTGNSATFLTSGGNINTRWGNFYTYVGTNLADVMHTIDAMPADQKAQYAYLRAITSIPYIYYAFYVSDANGSIPYTQAFKARYTSPPLLTPAYDQQEALFDTLDNQLQASIAVLKSNPSVSQVFPGQYAANDIYYQGNVTNWIKAANSLRLKIAMRLMKRNPARLTAIANQVLNDNVGLIDSPADEWILYAGPSVGNGGNSNPGNYSGEYNVVNFMWNTQDPRTRTFYQKSGITSQDMFDSAQAQGQIPASMTWDGQLYRGQFANPGASKDPANAAYFKTLNFTYKGAKQSVYFPSIIQDRLTYAAFNGGSGNNVFPVITYAEVCFLRAELVVRGLSSDPLSAAQLYNNGVTASITDYDKWGSYTQLADYTPLGSNEIANYLAQPAVAYNPANALEQICDQEYLNFYICPNEAWALIKRTGFPSAAGHIMPLEDVSAYGVMPRRYVVSYPVQGDLNYTNITNAIDSMKLDPNFGDPSDMTGRVWWDMP